MKSLNTQNISEKERWASMLMGGAFTVIGLAKKNRILGMAGLGLLARGASGYCPASAALGRDTSGREMSSSDTRQHLAGSRGVVVETSVRIDRRPADVYNYWRQFENLPRFMTHLREVRELGGAHSHWVAKGPLGMNVEWDAEIINDIPGQLISWKTVGESDVVSAGSVQFKGDGDGTLVRVKLQYDPPAGKVGAAVASMLGEDPQQQAEADLRRFKELLESNREEGSGFGAANMADPFPARS
jgi:uncharacterized membrane protein